ncbi:unnamed protein product [Linum trigynum]|uniref:Uncharacterized protein n=1 Tax=Linum trigynum TaxID=586398 RepID=A0AAV2DBJ6_9ROSI
MAFTTCVGIHNHSNVGTPGLQGTTKRMEAKEPGFMVNLPSKKNHANGDMQRLPHTKNISLHSSRRNSSWSWPWKLSWGIPLKTMCHSTIGAEEIIGAHGGAVCSRHR